MIGRKFRFANESAYYRIIAVGGVGSITLDNPYQGTTDLVGSTYTIFKDEYRLASDMDKNKTAIQIENRIPMRDVPPGEFDAIMPIAQSYSNPVFQIQSGTKLDTHTTGTVTCTGTTITGIGTKWLSVEGLGRMTRIIIGTAAYTVKTVNSDTSITVYETVTTVGAGTTYVIELRNIIVQFYQIPDAARLIYYRYLRIPEIMVNDYVASTFDRWTWSKTGPTPVIGKIVEITEDSYVIEYIQEHVVKTGEISSMWSKGHSQKIVATTNNRLGLPNVILDFIENYYNAHNDDFPIKHVFVEFIAVVPQSNGMRSDGKIADEISLSPESNTLIVPKIDYKNNTIFISHKPYKEYTLQKHELITLINKARNSEFAFEQVDSEFILTNEWINENL